MDRWIGKEEKTRIDFEEEKREETSRQGLKKRKLRKDCACVAVKPPS
jgi:hypothetical protein